MDSKPWYRSKMIWFNVAAFVVAVLQSFGFTGELPAAWAVFVPVIVAVVNIALRWITHQALTA